jgi:hypothetical protein
MVPFSRTIVALLATCLLFPSAAGASKKLPLADTASSAQTLTASEPACTLYASPSGSSTASGASATSPTSLRGARDKSVAGSVICLLPGTYSISSTFSITRSGTRTSPITYRAYSTAPVVQWTGAGGAYTVFLVNNYNHDVVFDGLVIDGAGRAATGIGCSSGSYGITVRHSTIRYTGAAGIYTGSCDYTRVESNFIYHTGYDPNTAWSSAVSLNHNVWKDTAAGFHSYVVGNVISGATDESILYNHTEGHGVIMDRGGNVPPVLIANNLIYENGGHCFNLYHVQNIWVVNNTCYKNGLDLRLTTSASDSEFMGNGSDTYNLHFVNNVGYAWNPRAAFWLANGAAAAFDHNLEYGGKTSGVPSTVRADPLQLRRADPLFQSPLWLDPALNLQQFNAFAPWLVGSRFMPQLGSPLIDRGVDPRTVAGMTADLRVGIDLYLRSDLNGNLRPAGYGWDIGAYEQ